MWCGAPRAGSATSRTVSFSGRQGRTRRPRSTAADGAAPGVRTRPVARRCASEDTSGGPGGERNGESRMKQAVTTAVREVTISETEGPGQPGPGDVLVEIAAVGICGSDIAMWAGTDPYASFPIRQGHEFSARIATFGPDYFGDLRVGQLCAVEPLLPDGTCIACRRGHPNCCRNLRVFGAHLD